MRSEISSFTYRCNSDSHPPLSQSFHKVGLSGIFAWAMEFWFNFSWFRGSNKPIQEQMPIEIFRYFIRSCSVLTLRLSSFPRHAWYLRMMISTMNNIIRDTDFCFSTMNTIVPDTDFRLLVDCVLTIYFAGYTKPRFKIVNVNVMWSLESVTYQTWIHLHGDLPLHS